MLKERVRAGILPLPAREVLSLRQQIAVLKRKRPRPVLNRLDRIFWTALAASGAVGLFRNQLVSDIRVFTYQPAVIGSFLAN